MRRLAQLALGLVAVCAVAGSDPTEDRFQEGRNALANGDNQRAAVLFREAADVGHAKAQSNLGALYRLGRGVEQSDREARRWYELAAGQGNAIAADNLGVLLSTTDPVTAERWFRQGAEQGYADAQLHLGLHLLQRESVVEARSWFEKAAAQNHVRAWNSLGALYEHGRGGALDLAQSAALYRRAALEGDAQAQANLGRLLATGTGVARDPVEAYFWLQLSTSQNEPTGRNFLYDYETNLSAEQRAEGERRLAEYRRRKMQTR